MTSQWVGEGVPKKQMKGTWLRELYTWQEGMGVQKSIKFADVIYGRPLIYARTLLAGCTILPLESWDSGLLPARGDDATSEVEQRGFRPLPLPRSVLLLWKEEGGNDTRDKGPFGRRERERERGQQRSFRSTTAELLARLPLNFPRSND